MLIKFTTKDAHVKVVPLVPISADARKVKISKSQIQLLPGNNFVTDNEWLIMKDHLATEISSGVLTVVEKRVEPSKRSPTGKARNLREMPVGIASDIIKDTTNPETLRKWYREETRDAVLQHIARRMKAVKIDPADDPDDGKNDIDTGDDDGSDTGNNGNDPLDKSGTKELDDMTINELRKYAEDNEIVVSGTKKDEILDAIKTAIVEKENGGGSNQ
jgi:hypothetical protein